MKRPIKSKILYFDLRKPDKKVKSWNKHKAAKKLKVDIEYIREFKQNNPDYSQKYIA